MRRVLHLLSNDLERRGGQIYIFDWLKYAPKEKYQFDVYFLGELIDKQFAQEFIDTGAMVYCGGNEQRSKIRKDIGYSRDLYKLIKENRYDIIHIHTGSPIFSAIGLIVAWMCGVRQRYSHAHTSFPSESRFKQLYYALPRAVNRRLSAMYIGVSRAAVEFLFGKDAYRRAEQVRVICPCIDTKRYVFREEVRSEIRKRFHMEESLVVGHVGGFTVEKNHGFLVDVFRLVAQASGDARLLLIGSGEGESAIRRQVREYGLEDKVTFVGPTDKVQEYMCAMDIFVLPSLREGFSLVLLEAQASGLPCIASDAVPPEVCVTDLMRYLPLSEGSESWAKAVLMTEPRTAKAREDSWRSILEAGFDNAAFTDIIGDLYQ